MMKKALVCVAILAVASTAMAAELLVMPKVTNASTGLIEPGVYPRGITPDGRFVGGVAGRGYSSGGVDVGFVYDAATGVGGHIVAGGYNETVDGIGYWTDGTTTKVVVEGSNGGWQSMNAWDTASSWNGTAQWEKIRRTSTHAYSGSGQNRMAGTSSNGVLYGAFQTSNTQLYIDAFNGTGFNALDTKGTTDSTTMNGISNSGKMVGVRAGRLYTVGPYIGGTTPAAGYVAAAPNGTDTGTFYDIADDGSVMGGMGPVTGKTGNWAFVFDGVTSTELPTLGGGVISATNSALYSIAPNGDYAVGMDYSFGYELAVLWDLRDMGNIQAINLTQFAADNGILGPFGGNLRRGTAIGINGDGNPVIAGIGQADSLAVDGWTGFVLTIPEPTSLAFLALGGLALLRRRR